MDARITKGLGVMMAVSAVGAAPPALAQAALLADAGLGSAQPEQAGTWTFHHEHVLGTSLELSVRAAGFAQAQHAEAAALAQFDRDDAVLSAWRKDSEFSRWAATRLEPVEISPVLFEVLGGFDLWREKTNGALDASAETAVRLWGAATAEGRVPDAHEIAITREAMAQPHWMLDREAGTAMRLSDVPIALASFAKSYITQRAANAALHAGASGVTLNVGGDVVTRGAMTQMVAIANPSAATENDSALDHVVIRDRAVATSGSYRRGFDLQQDVALHAPEFSHIVDPRTALPVGHVLSSTVIARDAETAGALATAFSVLPLKESEALAASLPGVEYMIVPREGAAVLSTGWPSYRVPGLSAVAYTMPAGKTAAAPVAGAWNPQYELAVGLELPKPADARYRRPYVAVWVEDADHFPVRTLALWLQNARWLPELKQWYRDDQIRNLAEGTDVSKTVSSATRPAGKYSLKWDGKDNEGKLVKPGKYTVCVEASREHGSYQIERHEMTFNGTPQQLALPPGKEMGAVTLDYRKR